MSCGDVILDNCDAWTAVPPIGLAAAGLLAALIEVPSSRHRTRPRASGALCLLAALGFVAIGALGAAGRLLPAGLALAGAIASSATGVWLARRAGTEDDGADGGGGGPGLPDVPGGGIDWDAFERDFGRYAARHGSRPRVLV